MNEYDKFLFKYFPNAQFLPDDKKALYSLVCENNIMSEIILNCISSCKMNLTTDFIMYYLRYRDGINKLLIYIPLNYDIGVYACMRYIIEQILKFIYSLYGENAAEKINRTSYRHIKEEIRLMRNMPEDIKEKVEKLYTYYAKYSNNVHDKSVDYDHELKFLSEILKDQNKYKDSICDIRSITFNVYDILISIFKITYQQLNLSERIKLSEVIKKNRKKRILELLKYS